MQIVINIQEGKVCAQNYAEGDKVVIGTKVDITLSLGPADVEPTGKPDTADDTPTRLQNRQMKMLNTIM